MNITVLSVFRNIFDPFLQTSLVHRAQESGKVHIQVKEYFDFVAPKERIDAPTFGPGAGMLIKPNVVQKAIEMQEDQLGSAYKIFLSPKGKKLDQQMLAQITDRSREKGHLMVLSSRYEGMDARVEKKYADEIVSIGDFVVMGGDVPAMLLLEGMLRLIPGVVGKQESVEKESFKGPFLDHPEYTEPVDWCGMVVPDVVRSGNHAVIDQWRQDQAAHKTVMERFDWVRSYQMSANEVRVAGKHIPSHYVALMHGDVLVKDGRVGTTSVTSLDIHDVARSCATYGIKNYFIVTPLKDQQKIVSTLLDFWQKGPGLTYNTTRADAVNRVRLASNFNDVVAHIEKIHGKKPIVISTSARAHKKEDMLSYYDQDIVWAHDRPVLILIGTGQGLSDELVKTCDYHVMPVRGFTDYNHLSVRSAVAIILDRWLGINEKR